MKILASILLVVFIVESCSNSFQYDVYVSNETGQVLRIEYRTNNAKTGVEENTIIVKDGDVNKLLLSTREIPKYNKLPMKDRTYCAKVATQIRAFTESGSEIHKNWCDENLKIEIVDIGQAEYLICYTREDL